MTEFKIIAAMSLNHVIGKNNKLPWFIPEELQWFKTVTLNQTLLMGRRTFESIGHVLPNRTTFVLSRNKIFENNVNLIQNIDELPKNLQTVLVCGGASLYEQFLTKCSELILSIINKKIDGDSYFPDFTKFFQKKEIIKKTDDFEVQRWVSIS